MTSTAEAFRITARNRRSLADVLEGLSPEQWEAPSLCQGWSVRVLAGHLLTPLLTGMTLGWTLRTMVRFRGDNGRAMDYYARTFADRPTADIVSLLRSHADGELSLPVVGPYGQLTDSFVHTLDVTRALGLSDPFEAGQWRVPLNFLTSPKARVGFVPRGRVEGLHLIASDTQWSHGSGQDVRGPAASLALAVAGRPLGLAGLTGEGVAVLTDRMSR